MSPEPGNHREENREEGPTPGPGSIPPTSISTLLGWAVAGVVVGWGVHAVCSRVGWVPPLVSWAQPLALLLLAAILGYTAWATHRAVQVRRERLATQHAVNRLLLARASAIVGAFVGAGYLGYAVSWIGDPAELADVRQVRSLVAAVCGLLVAVGGLLLERACRVRTEDD
ncbi:DUF3180 family protein [Nocardioides sp. GY 10113]|uniref:DUF3180 family protein n=1 Tax=Nocardioides sp. GY 10113 TaxID=2569761 RepID=UPI0010A927A1|nr:DUF3180 family protein [Nocardioides sp. GY 10113]TIC89214.1 DUF3180 family protein [Nocardioides sp. GY 10113]